MNRDRKREAYGHPAGVRFDRLPDEVADLGKSLDVGHAAVHVLGRKAENGAVQVDVIAPRKLGVETRAKLKQRGDTAVYFRASRIGGQNPGADLQQGAFSGAVFPHDAKGFAAGYLKTDVAQSPVVGVKPLLVEGRELLQPVARGG